jgi:hypothetical protein
MFIIIQPGRVEIISKRGKYYKPSKEEVQKTLRKTGFSMYKNDIDREI